MVRGQWVAVALLCACSSNPSSTVDASSDAPDEQVGPCTLPSLAQTVATLAGCSQNGSADGSRGAARFDNPTNVAIAANGIAYITDFDGDRLRSIDPTGTTTTVLEMNAFRKPFGIVLAPNNTLYVETDDNDTGGHSTSTGTIWRIDLVKKNAEVVARDLGRPRGLAVLSDGRIAMSDHMHHVVTILDPATGIVTPLAGVLDQPGYENGVGDGARFSQPYDIVLLPDGSLAVADMDNHRIRRVLLDGTVSDLAGSGAVGVINGPVAVATFDSPQALAVLPTGVLFVSDVKRRLIRKIANGVVSTIAGDGTPGWRDAADPRTARFYGLEGMDVDASRLVIADGNIGDGMPFNHIRVIVLAQLP